ncbi:globin domain-containing protein [Minwuia sp.]|uniref:globin domain-containing protein n=1 Tax=Minwuia sp. TaxID=2493630 RepID=UPI003A91CC23
MTFTAKLASIASALFISASLALMPAPASATTKLSDDEVRLVQESWTLIQPQMGGVVERFYRRYFQLDPAAKDLFNEKTMKVQFSALSNILGDVAAGADDLSGFANRFKRLGSLHQSLGAEPHQFALFGVAFVDTLRLEMKSDFKPRARTAWNKIFYEMSKMMEAGYGE